MGDILMNPYSASERRRRAEVVRHKAMIWLATKARPPYRPGGGDDGERGPAFWFTMPSVELAIGAFDRSDRQTVCRLFETLSRRGLKRGRVNVTPLIEWREGKYGEYEYRRTW